MVKPTLFSNFLWDGCELNPNLDGKRLVIWNIRNNNLAISSVKLQGLAHFSRHTYDAADECAAIRASRIERISFALPPVYETLGWRQTALSKRNAHTDEERNGDNAFRQMQSQITNAKLHN